MQINTEANMLIDYLCKIYFQMLKTLKFCTGCRKNVVPVLEKMLRQNVGCLYRGLQTETDRIALPLRPLKGKLLEKLAILIA